MHNVFIEASLNNLIPGKREIGEKIVDSHEDALPYYWENLWKRGGVNIKCYTLVNSLSILRAKAKYELQHAFFQCEWREQFVKEIGPLQRQCDDAIKEQVGRVWSGNQLVCGIGSSLPQGKRFAVVSTNYAHFLSAPLSTVAFSEVEVNTNKPRVIVNFDNHQDYYSNIPKQASTLPAMGKSKFRPTPELYGNWGWKPENGGWGAFHTHIAHTMWGPPYPPTCYCAVGCNNTGSVLSYVEYNTHGQIDAENSYIAQGPANKLTNGGSEDILRTLNTGLKNKDWQLYVTLDRDVLSSAVTHFRNHSTCTMATIKEWLKGFCDTANSVELVGADITGLPRNYSTIADHKNAVNDILSFRQAIMAM